MVNPTAVLLRDMKMMDRRVMLALAAVMIVLAASDVIYARATREQAGLTKEDEQSLRSRVGQWWTSREARDHQAMYQFFEPDYRNTTPFLTFLQESALRSRFDITSHDVVQIEPRGSDRVAVFVEIGTSFPQFPGPHKVTAEEPWVRVAGAWYKVHEPFKPPFPDKPAR
jgi:hypothetical protein